MFAALRHLGGCAGYEISCVINLFMFALPLVLMESNFPSWISVYSELYLQHSVFQPLLAAFYPSGCFPLTGDGEKSAGVGGLPLTEAQSARQETRRDRAVRVVDREQCFIFT